MIRPPDQTDPTKEVPGLRVDVTGLRPYEIHRVTVA